jgi:hypothetical protein
MSNAVYELISKWLEILRVKNLIFYIFLDEKNNE